MTRFKPLLLLILVAGLLMSSSLMAKDAAPEGRTYIVFVIGLADDPFAPDIDCLTFDATQACTLDNETCLQWQPTEDGFQTRNQSGFSLATELEEDGVVIGLEGQGRVDSRGPKSSISAVARAAAMDVQLNFALAGRQINRNRCRRMVEEFEMQQNSP